jgi:cytochrome c oxidase assembly protein subunit 15
LIFVQLGLGALVAGLRAGLIYNTWPLMDGRWIPAGLFASQPAIRSALDDVTTVQFDHRMTAYVVVAFALAQAFGTRGFGGGLSRRAGILAGAALLQAALGIITLVWVAPLPVALLHQAFALILFGLAAAHASATRQET